MKNQKKLRKGTVKNKDSGITLVALVVTIVILLILAGISLNLILGQNGIIKRATESKEKSGIAQIQDEIALAWNSVQLDGIPKGWDNSTKANALNTELLKEDGNASATWNTTNSVIDVTYKGYETTINPDTGTMTILAKAGTSSGTSTESGTDSSEGSSESESVSTPSADYLALKEGDTVYYKDVNNNDIKCTVLYASKDSLGNVTSYYSTYGVQIIPNNPVTKKELGNETGSLQTDATNFNTAKAVYNDAINILNTSAQNYVASQPNLAAIADSSRCVGSLPSNPSAQNTNWYTNSYSYFTTNYTEQFKAPESDSTYKASSTENYIVDKTQLDNLGIAIISDTTNGSYYWLASRNAAGYSDSTVFYAQSVSSGGSLHGWGLCSVTSNRVTRSWSYEYGLRPCITLKSSIKVTETNNKKYLSL